MVEKLSVTAQVPANEKKGTPQLGPVTISVECPTTAGEMIKMFGDEAVKTNAVANWTVTLQANIRGGLKRGETQEQMQVRLGAAKMGVAAKGIKVDPQQAYLALFQSATPEDQAKMIKELTQKAQKAAKG